MEVDVFFIENTGYKCSNKTEETCSLPISTSPSSAAEGDTDVDAVCSGNGRVDCLGAGGGGE